MNKLFLVLLMPFIIEAQTYFYFNNSEQYAPETTAYVDRVETDGGEIISIDAVNDAYLLLKGYNINLTTELKHWSSPNFGVKKDANNKVTKLYDLSSNNNDIAQTDTSKSPTWSNGYNTFDGSNDILYKTARLLSGATTAQLYAVIKTATAQNNKYPLSLPYTTSGNGVDLRLNTTGFAFGVNTTSGFLQPSATRTYNNNSPHILSGTFTASLPSSEIVAYYDLLTATSGTNAGDSIITTSTSQIAVGGFSTAYSTYSYTGSVADVVVLASSSYRTYFNNYLGLQYGQVSDLYKWNQLDDNALTFPKDGAVGYYFNNKHWLFGGWNDTNAVKTDNEIWSSTDGINWTDEGNASWDRMHTFGVYQKGDTLFKIGGDGYIRDSTTWKSTDGINWTQISANNGLSNKILMGYIASPTGDTVFAFNGHTSLAPLVTVGTYYRSVNNGRTFSLVGSTTWTGGNLYKCFVYYQNKYWKIAGGEYGNVSYTNGVYNSTNGVDWTLVTTMPVALQRTYLELKVYDDKIWMFGGNNGANISDTYYTMDGINWVKVSAPWTARHAHTAWVTPNGIYMFGGTGDDSYQRNEVWRLD